ncbi:predicted protein [Postia placenta Mad-698-R]|nr:predicted protein [Postia placenta Mad-698-R]
MSRTPTPDSPMSSSLRRATDTIDDLTLALSNFSRMSSPELADVATCCCGKDDCETTKAWQAWKSKMESRLILSAESANHSPISQLPSTSSAEEHVDARVADLVKENAVLEKRLTQALVNNEVAESSHRNALQELQEVQANAARLAAQNARSIGWENRLAVALQEKDDYQQERDIALQRAKLAEARISALKEKCAKSQAQLTRLREDFDMQRLHRQELSQEILQDARQRLAQLQQSESGPSTLSEDAEVTKILESLVADNEALKRDNAELQNMLAETREDVRALQEEVEERRAGDTSFRRHRYTNSGQSSNFEASSPLSSSFHVGTVPANSLLHSWQRHGHLGTPFNRRAASAERSTRRGFEPLTPETDRRPLSPTDSLVPSEMKWPSYGHPRTQHGFDVDEDSQHENPATPERTRAHKSLLMLTRSRGVQTDGSTNAAASSWMAPISKFLGLPGLGNPSDSAATRALSPPSRPGMRAPSRMPSRIVPKREAALSASAMTVNVEFSGTAVGRSVTSTYSAHPARQDSISILAMQGALTQVVPPPNVSRSVMGIFAGAPRAEDNADPWVVIPKPQRAGPMPHLGGSGTATVDRSALRRTSSRMSRMVDAVIDSHAAQGAISEEQDVVGSLLDRTLTRRGLSDSSIHTTFLSHEEQGSPRQSVHEESEESAPQDRSSVLQALSRRMQNFRFAGPSATSSADAGAPVSRPDTPVSGANAGDGRQTPTGTHASSPHAMSPPAVRLFSAANLSSWATASLDPSQEPSSYMAASPREEPFMHRLARDRNM